MLRTALESAAPSDVLEVQLLVDLLTVGLVAYISGRWLLALV